MNGCGRDAGGGVGDGMVQGAGGGGARYRGGDCVRGWNHGRRRNDKVHFKLAISIRGYGGQVVGAVLDSHPETFR